MELACHHIYKSNLLQTTQQEDVMFKLLAVIKLSHKAHLKRQICNDILLLFRTIALCNLQEMIVFNYHIVYVCYCMSGKYFVFV